ncbi:MAG: response regulator [Actinomycetota bacterium]
MASIVILFQHPDIEAVVRRQFASDGYDVDVASDSENAWKRTITDPPSALVVDVGMPSAWRLIEQVRGDARVNRLPVIAVSASVGTFVENRASTLSAACIMGPLATSSLSIQLHQAKMIASALPELAPVIDLRQVRANIFIGEEFQITGTLHLPREADRFQDGWESILNDNRNFVPVTDAEVIIHNGSKHVSTASFLEVRKADIVAVQPLEDAALIDA